MKKLKMELPFSKVPILFMIEIAGYNNLQELHSGKNSLVFRASKENETYIIKLLNKEYPETYAINRFRNEFNVLNKIHGNGIIKAFELLKYKNSYAIVFEDIGGETIHQIFNRNVNYTVLEILDIMILVTTALGEIHKTDAVHNDIKAQNIIYNPNTKQLKIIDFGSASFLNKQFLLDHMMSSIEGTLAHISPEQTGRINRSVDYRTDYYSLGVTFYKLLTGELPFDYAYPISLVHAHIAKTPISPFERNRTPIILSKIVMKLLSKNPEDRYQTIEGILADIEKAKQLLIARGLDFLKYEDLSIDEQDFSRKFIISKRIYGRTEELEKIFQIFQSTSKGNLELLLVSGSSGIGKSVLINEVNRMIASSQGYFSSGKYDLYKKSIPYRAITQGLKKLIRKILTENQDSIENWQNLIQAAVGENGKLITDLIPDLINLIGAQSDTIPMEPQEAEYRFRKIFLRFIKVFCRTDSPFILFLDDLQWADNSSIELIDSILSDSEIKNFFLILSYRDKEVLPTDAFANLLQKIQENPVNKYFIHLNPITKSDIQALIAETLGLPAAKVDELSDVVYSKTLGNPFFVNELLRSLYDRGFIYLEDRTWTWDIDRIKDVKISENVIDLIIENMKDLAPDRLEILKMASCIGSRFSLDLFAEVVGKNRDDFMEDLIFLSNQEYFILGEKFVSFVHDKINESAYTFLNDQEKARNHYLIGSTYLRMSERFKLEEFIFVIVNQLNLGSNQISSDLELDQLIDLNILAGEKALNSNAHIQALKFYEKAISLLQNATWESDYDRYLNAFIGLAKSEFLSKDFDRAEKTFNLIIEKSKSILDTIVIHEMRSMMFASQNRMLEVIDLLKIALKELGEKLPENPTKLSPVLDLIQFKIKMRNRSVNDLKNLHEMTDPVDLAKMKLLNSLIAPSFLAQTNLFPVIVLRMINLTLTKGLSQISPFALVSFGMIQGFGLGDFDLGQKFGELGIELLKRPDAKVFRCRSLFLFACMINHWKNHAKESKPLILKALQDGIETGDIQYAAYSLNNYLFQSSLIRENLKAVEENFEKYNLSIQSLNQWNAYQVFNLERQSISNLLGQNLQITKLNGEYFQEDIVLKEWIDTNNENGLFQYYMTKLRLEYLFGDMDMAYEFSKKCEQYESAVFAMMFIPEFVFLQGLVSYQLWNRCDGKSKKVYSNVLKRNLKRLKVWAKYSQANYGHKYEILLGLEYATKKKTDDAFLHFQNAIDLAKSNEFYLEEAITNELWASILEEQGQSRYANVHLLEAHYIYSLWGADSKVKLLEIIHPYFKTYSKRYIRSQASDLSSQSISKSSSTAENSFLDLNSVIKASRLLSGDMNLAKFLENMMIILLENAGAEKGLFFLKQNDTWMVQAEGYSNSLNISVLQSQPVYMSNSDSPDSDEQKFAQTIVNYVIHTEEIVILHDATLHGVFSNDVYIKKNKIKSLLCYPIFNHGNLVALAYLENNLTTEAFTRDRLELLKILGAQIAVSLENSILYSMLEEKVKKRTEDLNEALLEVQGLKVKQDGDYFLTSLLIEPLRRNQSKAPNIKIEFLTEQIKKFQYRDSSLEIGGDLSVAESIELKNRKYSVIMNGDAMGKSMQGAAGALVLGSVFESILKRLDLDRISNDVYPELWLKNAFKELHTVFTTFSGSMLVSIFIGLIDEKTGLLYYITAEHPIPVLYRDKKASFLPMLYSYTKLGMLHTRKKIQINTFKLLDNDILIFGSDGKDDFLVSDGKGDKVINEDETLFLEIVENSVADLKEIVKLIKIKGELMDDLSLGKVIFQLPESEKKLLENRNYESQYIKLQELYESRDYRRVIQLFDNFLEENPNIFSSKKVLRLLMETSIKIRNIEMLLNYAIHYNENLGFDIGSLSVIARCYKLLGKLELAIEYAERIRLRYPGNVKNLKLLSSLYRRTGNLKRAEKILSQSESPDQPSV
ncbi:protein kinase domain-containing protein [Leptospira sp. GIMC2001]|uniref:protein kinase domain-containing protein n=1 Tax=Leptospira sp. GIMC2001 TaxID=1513297 RepID=UPI00234A868F|nr:AAA family ATPase [Leptospira sp. GIMC2001]WCL50568.1 AAA family ATPase [Leptospira sp. GIMC2001]